MSTWPDIAELPSQPPLIRRPRRGFFLELIYLNNGLVGGVPDVNLATTAITLAQVRDILDCGIALEHELRPQMVYQFTVRESTSKLPLNSWSFAAVSPEL